MATHNVFTKLANRMVSATMDGVVFKPMLCAKAAWGISQQYVPYKPGYDELVARIEALEAGS